jgi:hypothetical protein
MNCIRWEVRSRLVANGQFKHLNHSLVFCWNLHTSVGSVWGCRKWFFWWLFCCMLYLCQFGVALFCAFSGCFCYWSCGFGFVHLCYLSLEVVACVFSFFRLVFLASKLAFSVLRLCSRLFCFWSVCWVLFNEIFYSSKNKKKLSQRVKWFRVCLRPVHLKKKLFNFPILEIKKSFV